MVVLANTFVTYRAHANATYGYSEWRDNISKLMRLTTLNKIIRRVTMTLPLQIAIVRNTSMTMSVEISRYNLNSDNILTFRKSDRECRKRYRKKLVYCSQSQRETHLSWRDIVVSNPTLPSELDHWMKRCTNFWSERQFLRLMRHQDAPK